MKCPECGKDFTALKGLIAHRRWKHNANKNMKKIVANELQAIGMMPTDPLVTIRRVKSVAREVGGLDALAELVEAIG